MCSISLFEEFPLLVFSFVFRLNDHNSFSFFFFFFAVTFSRIPVVLIPLSSLQFYIFHKLWLSSFSKIGKRNPAVALAEQNRIEELFTGYLSVYTFQYGLSLFATEWHC